jgi:hypothetical protein
LKDIYFLKHKKPQLGAYVNYITVRTTKNLAVKGYNYVPRLIYVILTTLKGARALL